MIAQSTESLSYKFWKVALVLLVVVYLCNFFTPLRLTNDTIRYFRLVEEQLGTWPAPHFQDFLPFGYVWTLFGLAKAGILNSFTIAALNGLMLAGSLYFLKKLFSTQRHFIWMVVLLFLNWNTIKFTLTPLSEMQFLFFSSGCLYFYSAFGEAHKFRHLLFSIIFCALAIYTRTAGMSLGLALLLTPLLENWKNILTWVRSNKLIALGIALAIFALLVFQMNQYGVLKYMNYYRVSDAQNPLIALLTTCWLHIQEIGELLINIPLGKAITIVPPVATKILYTSTGAFFVMLLFRAIFSKKLEIPSVVRVYFMIYFIMICCWPFFEVRFWFPVFPLILLIILAQVNSVVLREKWMGLRNFYFGSYFLTGLFSISYYTWLSLSREAMAEHHDAGQWKKQYRAHFFGEPFNSGMFEDDAIYILDKYDAAHKSASVDQQFPERR